ncbi:MAG: hypothetical protein V4563_15030 [Pseudomonadota bacterium]
MSNTSSNKKTSRKELMRRISRFEKNQKLLEAIKIFNADSGKSTNDNHKVDVTRTIAMKRAQISKQSFLDIRNLVLGDMRQKDISNFVGSRVYSLQDLFVIGRGFGFCCCNGLRFDGVCSGEFFGLSHRLSLVELSNIGKGGNASVPA